MEKTVAVELIRKFNKNNNKRHLARSENLHKLIENACKQYGDDVVTEIVSTVKSDNIYEVVDLFYIKKWIEDHKQPYDPELLEDDEDLIEVELETPKTPKAESGMTLGLIEKALAKVMLDEYAPKVYETAKNRVEKFVSETYGTIERKIEYVVPERGKLDEVTHERFETVMKFVMADEPVMLVGPAGSGKNVIVKQVSKLLDIPFYFTNAVSQEFQLKGFIDAMGKFHETEFYKAFKYGGIFMLDEIDASIPEVLVILNAAIANRYFDFPNGRIDAHENFRVIAAGNTFGNGASYQYVGRNQLDGASLNRFAIVEIGYSPKVETAISNDMELIEFVRDFRGSCETSGVNHIVSYRELSRMDKMMKVGLGLSETLKTCLTKNLDVDDLRMVVGSMKKVDNKYRKELAKQC